MTRINCVPVQELTDKHLLAEYRELPRVFKLARDCNSIPPKYTLGTGHVKFFYNKCLWLVGRYNELIDELELRGFNLNKDMYYSILEHAQQLPTRFMGDWVVTDEAMYINRKRIADRLAGI